MPDTVELHAPGMSVLLDLANGGRAVSWMIDGLEILGTKSSDPVEYGMYPMAPWAGRVRDNALMFAGVQYPLRPSHGEWALHGTVLGSRARLTNCESSDEGASATIVTDLGPDWPWTGLLTCRWEVRADCVTTTLTLEADTEAFPGVLGWHPWFRRSLGVGQPARWDLPDPLLAEREDGFRLTGALVAVDLASRAFDDTFLVESRSASIEWPEHLRIDVTSSHPWFVVFDELADFICIEPQSGPPNGINDSLVAPATIVDDEQPLTLTNDWRIRRGRPAE